MIFGSAGLRFGSELFESLGIIVTVEIGRDVFEGVGLSDDEGFCELLLALMALMKRVRSMLTMPVSARV